MEELQKGLYKEQKAEREMEQAESQLHMWDSHFRMITQVSELGTCFFGPSYTKIPFNTNDLFSTVKMSRMLEEGFF